MIKLYFVINIIRKAWDIKKLKTIKSLITGIDKKDLLETFKFKNLNLSCIIYKCNAMGLKS